MNGKIIYKGGYFGAKKHGKGKEYYSNNKIQFEGEYLYNNKNKGKLYHINGKLE